MKRILLIPVSLPLAAIFCMGQTGTVALHPASDGKTLTLEEAILSRAVLPRQIHAQWTGPHTFSFLDPSTGEFRQEDVRTGASGPFRPARSAAWTALPEGAENPVEGPDGSVAFTLDRALLYADTLGAVHPVAASDDPPLTFGQSVSRNEFGIETGIFWSPGGGRIAFYAKDETRVGDFPLLDITTRTGSLRSIKYPMNGMDSERIRLGLYDRSDGSTVYVAADDFGPDRYLTGVSWSPDERHVFIQVLDRSQKHMRLNMYRAADGSFVRTLLTEDNDRYTEPLDPLYFLSGRGEFLYRTDNRDGYRNLYLCDTLGSVRRLTCVDADVSYVGNDGHYVYYTSAEVSPVENHLFRIPLIARKGRPLRIGQPQRLTREPGWHEVSISPGFDWIIDNYSAFNLPGKTDLLRSDGSLIRTLHEAADPLRGYSVPEISLGTVPSADGRWENWYRLYKPVGFDPARKYPVILYVYGGPHSQMVQDRWLGNIRMWELYMAQRGYVVYVQDNRGTSNRGAAYEKAIHRRCGQVEMEDQMAGIRMLKSLPWVDTTRIGVHGWSYGGFMTISLMTHYPETFPVGVAGGPVIDWKWYEVMYGERYMETEATNPEGFAQTSLTGRAGDLQGKLLICQGAIDNTVVWEHSLSFIQRCIEENIPVDYFPYPCSEHNVYGRWRVHLMDKVTEYFDRNL